MDVVYWNDGTHDVIYHPIDFAYCIRERLGDSAAEYVETLCVENGTQELEIKELEDRVEGAIDYWRGELVSTKNALAEILYSAGRINRKKLETLYQEIDRIL